MSERETPTDFSGISRFKLNHGLSAMTGTIVCAISRRYRRERYSAPLWVDLFLSLWLFFPLSHLYDPLPPEGRRAPGSRMHPTTRLHVSPRGNTVDLLLIGGYYSRGFGPIFLESVWPAIIELPLVYLRVLACLMGKVRKVCS
jgi:hypothetical protein